MSINTTLADSFVFVKKYQQAFWRRCRETVAIFFKPILSSYLYPFYKNKKNIFFLSFSQELNSYPIPVRFKGGILRATMFSKTKNLIRL
jgi:hypothetical protein